MGLAVGFARRMSGAIAGAPVGNATGQSIAAMVPRVREGGYGLVHGNGGVLSSQATVILGTEETL